MDSFTVAVLALPPAEQDALMLAILESRRGGKKKVAKPAAPASATAPAEPTAEPAKKAPNAWVTYIGTVRSVVQQHTQSAFGYSAAMKLASKLKASGTMSEDPEVILAAYHESVGSDTAATTAAA